MKEALELMGFEVLTDWGDTFLVHHPLITHENQRIDQKDIGLLQAHRWLIHTAPQDSIGRESAILRSRAALVAYMEAAA